MHVERVRKPFLLEIIYPMTNPLDKYKEEFIVTRNWIYFNHAATAPYSKMTAEAMERYIKDMTENGGMHYEQWESTREDLRQLAGNLLNGRIEEIALISNTSEGANIVAQGLALEPGDNIVIPEGEFPANFYPWRNLEGKGVATRIVPLVDGRVQIEDIVSYMNDRTKLVALSSVAYHNGFRPDLQTLGNLLHSRGIPLYVDAIQSLGVLPMDVAACRISFLSADGHKWLLGPEGAALFYCSMEALPLLKPAYVSWMSVREPSRFDLISQDLAEGARRFECGTPNFAGVAGPRQSLKMLLEIGIDRIMDHVLHLNRIAGEGLEKKGYPILSPWNEGERSGILSFTHPKHTPESLAELLNHAKVVTTVRGKGVRISPHFYNTEEEVEKFLKALP